MKTIEKFIARKLDNVQIKNVTGSGARHDAQTNQSNTQIAYGSAVTYTYDGYTGEERWTVVDLCRK
jgi:hypothetical protein